MRRIKLNRLFESGSIGGLMLLLLTILACPGFSNANAVDEYILPFNEDAAKETKSVGAVAAVYIKPSLSIALTNIRLNLKSEDGNFLSDTTDLKVETNGASGFKIYLNTPNGTDLIASEDSANKIPTISGKLSSDAFPETSSAWGYYVADANATTTPEYQGATIEAAVAKENSTPTPSSNYKLGVGIKVGPDTPVGNYQNNLIVSVIANPTAVRNLASITNMQQMTPELCRDTPKYINTSNYAWKNLVDTRNNTAYRVAKLNDGNCWMTQNLALNLGFAATPNDTDIITNKTLSGSYWHPNSYWYYSFSAATAKSGDSLTKDGDVAPESICPRGWKLPLSGLNYNTITQSGNPSGQLGSGSFNDLLVAHGITNQSSMVSIGESLPLGFGRVGFYDNQIVNASMDGRYWSGVSYNSTSSYMLLWITSYGTTFSPSSGSGRSTGLSVRCVALSAK